MTIDTSTEAVTKLLNGVTTGDWFSDGCRVEDFIPAARDLVPALIAERDALRAEVERLKAQSITVQDAAKVPEIKALIESATIVDDSYWNSTDGVIRGMYDLGVALHNITEGSE